MLEEYNMQLNAMAKNLNNLTKKEESLLETIISYYDESDEEGYMESLTASEKGVAGSLVKKDLIFDASDYDTKESNWKPTTGGLLVHDS
jgi:hypothetical protein